MSITLVEMADLVREPKFVNLVTALLAVTATHILKNDDPASLPGGDVQFQYRKVFAEQVISDVELAARKKLWVIAGFSPTTTPWTISDGVLMTAVLSEWDSLSSYSENQPVNGV